MWVGGCSDRGGRQVRWCARGQGWWGGVYAGWWAVQWGCSTAKSCMRVHARRHVPLNQSTACAGALSATFATRQARSKRKPADEPRGLRPARGRRSKFGFHCVQRAGHASAPAGITAKGTHPAGSRAGTAAARRSMRPAPALPGSAPSAPAEGRRGARGSAVLGMGERSSTQSSHRGVPACRQVYKEPGRHRRWQAGGGSQRVRKGEGRQAGRMQDACIGLM